jgi:hypothetical protein
MMPSIGDFGHQRIDVGPHLQRPQRIGDRARGDDQRPLVPVSPFGAAFFQEIIGSASHHHSPDPLQEDRIVMVAKVHAIIGKQPVQAALRIRDEAIQTGRDVAKNPRHPIPLVNK